MATVNILNLKEHWVVFDKETEILKLRDVDICTIEEIEEKGLWRVNSYDSDFQMLFQSLEMEYSPMTKDQLKNKVGNIFIGWHERIDWLLKSPCPNV